MKRSFLRSSVTPYAKNSTLSEACVSKLDPHWAADEGDVLRLVVTCFASIANRS